MLGGVFPEPSQTQTLSSYSFHHLKQLITPHIHTHCAGDRLEADDQSVILTAGTALTEATVECVSSNLHPGHDPCQTAELAVSEIHSHTFRVWYMLFRLKLTS